MKKLIEVADHYVETSNWRTIAVLKFCVMALGVIIGALVKPKYKKPTIIAALCVFIATYIPLMMKFYNVFTGKE